MSGVTGYEVQTYRNIEMIAKSMRRIADSLESIDGKMSSNEPMDEEEPSSGNLERRLELQALLQALRAKYPDA